MLGGAPRRVIPRTPPKLLLRQLHHHHASANAENEDSIRFYKSRGQHILVNPRILHTIVTKSAINPTDTVLEIGPGTGNLTLKLLQAAHRVVAIEIDDRMVHVLEKRVLQHGLRHKLHVIQKDALRTQFPHFDLVVANIPYGISSPLLMKLVYGATPFRSATLLLQKEFAGRLLANPGDSEFNRLAVNVKLVADVEFVMDVSKRDFLPCPKVDSSVVIIRPKDQLPDVDIHEWRAFTRTCFSRKNKTLGATFKQKSKLLRLFKLFNVSGFAEEDDDDDAGGCQRPFKEKIIGVLKTGGYEDKRPSKLSIEELLHLLSLFNGAGIYFHDCRKNCNQDRFAEDDDDG
ncbi:Ribosomal RNA small subunit methyltransferase, mitochondrial [Stylosanthes scabra]|uniref:rRNA adenine N(6)-methyltransferase n=1 Tax=Stylosanthes scabra TaxID=79078 RepID=A0ABU6VKD3_9FABA|nr:Ribosomal RNA small subunit methyltransferase, mitochondrial [Stylosanthes scabra]